MSAFGEIYYGEERVNTEERKWRRRKKLSSPATVLRIYMRTIISRAKCEEEKKIERTENEKTERKKWFSEK